jgi:hypothetical protein
MTTTELIDILEKQLPNKFAGGHDFIGGFFIEDITGIQTKEEFINRSNLNNIKRFYMRQFTSIENLVEFFKIKENL